jgi:hypothetical protein
MPVSNRPIGPGSQATIRSIVRCLIDNRMYARPISQVVSVTNRYGEMTITASPSRSHTRWSQWNFAVFSSYGDRGVRVWTGDTGDWRDTVRDVIVSELQSRGYEISDQSRIEWSRFRMRRNGWRRLDTVPVCGVRVSSSMLNKLNEWDTKQGCKVSRMFFSTHADNGVVTEPFITPLVSQYLTIRDDGTISYLPKGRYETAEQPWRPSGGRQQGRPARVIRAMMTPKALEELTDKDWEAFASRIKGAAEADKLTIELVTGDDIRYWYDGDHYQSGSGDLDNSCMRYDECQTYFGIYTDNPDQCALLTARNGGNRLVGRTLIWTTTEGKRVHDRVYGSEASRAALIDWCHDNDINQVGYGDLVQLENPWHDQYPYMDNMHYIDPDGVIGRGDDRSNSRSFGGLNGGTDLSSGPGHCEECDEFTGWGRRSSSLCQSCRRAREQRERRERMEAMMTNPPATMTYQEYLQLPNGTSDLCREGDGNSYLYVGVRGTNGRIEDGAARYRYYSDRFVSDMDGVIMFELAPVTMPETVTVAAEAVVS